jgi:hypothetical protein
VNRFWLGLCFNLPAEVIVMHLGSLLFVIAFAVIIIGPIARLLLGWISRANRGPAASPLAERPS